MSVPGPPPSGPAASLTQRFFPFWTTRRDDPLWTDPRPVRSELFGIERLAHHALSLAAEQQIATERTVRVAPLSRRLKENEKVLFAAYGKLADGLRDGQSVTPAAEWLLDNFHVVEEQIRQISTDLPPGFYRQIPKLATGPFAGYPRVFGIAWNFVAHTDSLFSQAALERFVEAYQRVDPLTIGELWAIAISLRIVLIENMRRLADLVVEGMVLRAKADALVDSVLGSKGAERTPLHLAVAPHESAELPEIMAGQLVRRLRGYDPSETPLLGWLVDHLSRRGLTLDEVVQRRQSQQGATNLSMRNIVTSMRALSETDWPKFVEKVSLVHRKLATAPDFVDWDFATRNQYRTAIENLARGSRFDELDVTDMALAAVADDTEPAQRDPGRVLIGEERRDFEAVLGFRPPLRLILKRLVKSAGLRGYLVSVAGLSGLLLYAVLQNFDGLGLLPLLFLGALLLPLASEFGTAITNLIVTRFIGPEVISSLDFEKGVPDDFRTLVVVPVLLSNMDELDEQLERLEVHYLSSVGGAVHYVLLSDGPDADREVLDKDAALIERARAGIAELNGKYPSDNSDRFILLHRHRRWNASEGCWMGWERKRGKLVELNRLLRSNETTSFMALGGTAPKVPENVRYVITLDADTELSRDTVYRLIGKMAHPLNRPRFDAGQNRIVAGYGILQPRVTPSLPSDRNGSLYARVFSSAGGIDPYAAAASDVYQDIFGEGSFTGKGIYDVDAFMRAVGERVPENAMLSHDLFEGSYARAGLASDVEVVEEFPARYDVDARRQHRWVRGDWQLLPWIFGPRGRDLTALGRAKMLDNLRRSILAPSTLAALVAGWMLPPMLALAWTEAVLMVAGLPFLLSLPFAVVPGRAGINSRSHFAALAADAKTAFARIWLGIALIPYSAWLMADAILRTLLRVFVTGRKLLEWVTAAESGRGGLGSPLRQYLRMAGGPMLGAAGCSLALYLNPAAWPVVVPFLILWLATPPLMHGISRPSSRITVPKLQTAEVRDLRLIARKTWRFFDTFVTESENHLPPDNFQEIPLPVVAHRTSPTNIGLYLLSTVVARDLRWISHEATLTRLEQTLATMGRMARLRGHFYNWYDTRDLRVLPPDYISSVDSGNLAGHLIAVAQALETQLGYDARLQRQAVADALRLAQAALRSSGGDDAALAGIIVELEGDAAYVDTVRVQLDELPAFDDPDANYWIEAARAACFVAPSDDDASRCAAAARLCRKLAMEMDFAFLIDPDKKLLSIGYSASANTLDPSCYDLLASEARLASLFAIAKGDVETRHWFRLGRSATPIGAGSALISWSGSMFEYLMPSLVMRAPIGSVLEQTSRLIVERQQSYAAKLGLPWGVSESSYNARDLEMTYQYSNFGVPGLGLKRGLSQNQVVAPYATGLASMVDPPAAAQNYARLAELGAEGRYGFYEAVDFTLSRVTEGKDHALVQSFMAHHQGMTITAIGNVLLNGRLRSWFHAEPIIQSVALLLQERVPRDATTNRPRAEKVVSSPLQDEKSPGLRRFDDPHSAAPTAHVLSNPHCGLTLTPSGAGHSQWHDIAISRRNDDPSRDALGSFIFLRDAGDGTVWSATAAPLAGDDAPRSAVFSEHQAEFTHRGARITTKTEAVVSAEDDAEARRVTLTNTSRHDHVIEVTSYVELALAPAAADRAHPAFSKMFVVTDILPELEVLFATRRKRSPDEPEVWVAHLAVVEGEETAPMQFETDRARFIGRGRSIEDPVALTTPLGGSKGTVLDPIFAMRRIVRVPVGRAVRVTFWTLVAETSTELLALVERHRDASGFSRAVTLAWTQSQVQLRHLNITHAEASDFQRLSGIIERANPRLRSSAAQIVAGAGPQSALWSAGISGDLPIVLVRIDDVSDITQVQEALTAYEYWTLRHIPVDLVILNERSSSYVQDLQQALETAVRALQLKPVPPRQTGRTAKGKVYVMRSDLITDETRVMLLAVASVVLVAGRGKIGAQIDGAAGKPLIARPAPAPAPPPPTRAQRAGAQVEPLEFFNGIGGFADNGREYVTILDNGQTTPAPWINVIANPAFGFHASAEGSGAIWSENSRENLLTPWSNDPVTDRPGAAIYLKDCTSGAIWTPTALPIRTTGRYVARHGFGYSRFEHEANGVRSDLVLFVPVKGAVRVSHLTLANTTTEAKTLDVTLYAEWVLGPSRAATARHILTERDESTGAIFARNPFAIAFPGRVAFADAGDATASFSADRAAFLGPGGSLTNPAALRADGLNGRTGPALDPCAALQRRLTLAPGETAEVTFLIGQAPSDDAARALIERIRAADKNALLAEVKSSWSDVLTAVQVETPDRAMDIVLNGWLVYQTLSCRIWARSGFYQASGAYGFRDQLQDNMALLLTRPGMTREHLLRVAARQFPEGDVQHWWLPHSGQGVRTHISDDRVWLGFTAAFYVESSGDEAVFDEMVPFLDGPKVPGGQHDAFYQPHISEENASLFEHCARGLDLAIAKIGENGIPLIGTGDWNDGMNRVGEGGKGTSVWLGWLLVATLRAMLPHAEARDPSRAARWRAHADKVAAAIEREAWDGEWYRRGTYDDGTPLGTSQAGECRIDSIAQSWAVLSGVAPRDRARQAMASVTRHLVKRDTGLALLFTPPFDSGPQDPGYIKGYPPGLRENGGQYSHAAMWAILAHARLGDGDAAADLFALVNPINHARTTEDALRYKVEPYVIAADVYSAPSLKGRGGWTWYTGSAAWMYRAGIEGLIGLSRHGETLRLDPCIPRSWPEVKVTLAFEKGRFAIRVINRSGEGHGVKSVRIDGRDVGHTDALSLPLDGTDRDVEVVL